MAIFVSRHEQDRVGTYLGAINRGVHSDRVKMVGGTWQEVVGEFYLFTMPPWCRWLEHWPFVPGAWVQILTVAPFFLLI